MPQQISQKNQKLIPFDHKKENREIASRSFKKQIAIQRSLGAASEFEEVVNRKQGST
jgi:hypothetical protein